MEVIIYIYAVKPHDAKAFRFWVLESKINYTKPDLYSEFRLLAEIPINKETELTGYYNEFTHAIEFAKVEDVIRLFAEYRTKEALIELFKPYLKQTLTESPLFP